MRRTKSGLPKWCSWNRDRADGKRRTLFRKTGCKSVYLPGAPWSEEFMRAYAAACASETAPIASTTTKPGSIDELVESYYRLIFPTLGENTRAMRRGVLERFRKEHGSKRVAHLQHEYVAAIIAAKAKTPHAGNNLRKILRHMLDHAVEIRMIAHNPAMRVKRLKTAKKGLHCWTDQEIAQYRAYWQLGTQQRTAMELALETTSRRADVTKTGRQHERAPTPEAPLGWLDLRHTKNDSEAFIPISPELRAALDAMPVRHLTYLHTRNGAPRSPKALGGDFRQWCDAAGLPKRCTIHGLRKGNLRRHAEWGATTKELQALGGHKSLSALQPYIDASDKAKLAVSAIAKRRASK